MIINQMTDSEAAKILELGSSFTGVEELSAYRKLVRMYHPDNYEMASEEEKINAHNKMLKINEAHDYLKKKHFSSSADLERVINVNGNTINYQTRFTGFNTANTNNNHKDPVLEMYKKEKIEYILNYISGVDAYQFPNYIVDSVKSFVKCCYETIVGIKAASNKSDIDAELESFELIKSSEYTIVLLKYQDNNNININIKKVSYNCGIIEFYEQLESIKEKNQGNIFKKKEYIKKLEEERKIYQTFYGYNKLENIINNLIVNALDTMEQNNFYNPAADLLQMQNAILTVFKKNLMEELNHSVEKYKDYAGYNNYIENHIKLAIDGAIYNAAYRNFNIEEVERIKELLNKTVENIFKTSYSIVKRINDLETIFKDNPNLLEIDGLRSAYNELMKTINDFNNGDEVSLTLNTIEQKVDTLVKKYNKQKDLANNKEYIEAYQDFINRFNNKISTLNPISDYEEIQNINRIYNSVQNILTKVLKDQIDLEKLIMCLERITFEDYDLDLKLINGLTPLKSDIYLKQDWNSRISLYLLKIKDGKRYLYRNGSSYDETEVNDDLAGFTSLDDMINSSTFVGKNAIKLENPGKGQHLYILYRYNDVVFYLNERFANHVLVKQGLHYQLKDEMDLSDIGLKYQNKDLFIEELRTKLEAKYQETSKKDEKDSAVKSRI